jgi:hypothetical protein
VLIRQKDHAKFCAQQHNRKERSMTRNGQVRLVVASVWWLSMASMAGATSELEQVHPQLLPGDRVLLGTVEEVRSEQARVDTGELQPRFIPMGVRKAKGLPELKKGDRIEITVNDQNLLVDVHVTGESSHHSVVRGQLVEPLPTGHGAAVLRTVRGQEASYSIRPVARSKVASIPVGVDAVFLIDESDRIVDVTFGSKEAVQRAAELWEKKSPLKGNFRRVTGAILTPMGNKKVAIRDEQGNAQSYDVRPLVEQQLARLGKGDAVILFVDNENKVTDVAVPPSPSPGGQR